MHEVKGKIVTAAEVAEFYKQYPGFWFLLEVLEISKDGKAERMRVVRYNKNKDVLREYILEESVDMNSKYIFVFASPDGRCEI